MNLENNFWDHQNNYEGNSFMMKIDVKSSVKKCKKII